MAETKLFAGYETHEACVWRAGWTIVLPQFVRNMFDWKDLAAIPTYRPIRRAFDGPRKTNNHCRGGARGGGEPELGI